MKSCHHGVELFSNDADRGSLSLGSDLSNVAQSIKLILILKFDVGVSIDLTL